jgi:D-alanyl-lipoteichoic acid acyltransferase DltB (MBOAT superfamily)
VAIGIGCFLGIQLPENFAAPYLKSNIALFWNSWHISLTQWFRSYVFNPLTRALRTSPRPVPTWLAILVTQASTMLLIGLWHGISWSFAVWGLWHGMGLFVHNRWENLVRNRMPAWTRSPRGMIATRIAGVLLTFHFVALGWVFFVLSSPSSAWETLLKLFGAA